MARMQPVRFDGEVYRFQRCATCRSRFYDPMPDDDAIGAMYGADYASRFVDPYAIDSPKWDDWVIERLRSHGGTFVDFGAGQGRLLEKVTSEGFEATGVELDAVVASGLAEQLRLPVLTTDEFARNPATFDVIHFGDVLEHLPDPAVHLRSAIAHLAPDGLVLAQGPLEGNRSLFTGALLASQRFRSRTVRDDLPTHLVLATVIGQLRLFERVGLATVRFDVYEVDWPAPSRLRVDDRANRRVVALFACRQLSKAVSSRFTRWGNRYTYEGRTQASPAAPPKMDQPSCSRT